MKKYEKPLVELSQSLAFKHAKLIDDRYTLSIHDLNPSDKLELISNFMRMNANLDDYLQEFLDNACLDRNYAEMQLAIEQNDRDLNYDF